MSRPTVIDDEHILGTAAELFVARGVAVTTAEIATRCGVSEGSLFKRWRTKEELFRAAIDRGLVSAAPFLDGLEARVGRSTLRVELEDLAQQGIEHLRRIVPLVMTSWSGDPTTRSACGHPNGPVPMQVLLGLTRYFEAEMRLGRMRRLDPEIVARTFVGTLWHYVMLETLFPGDGTLPMPETTLVRGFVDLLLEGACPTHEGAEGRPFTRTR